MVEEVNIVSKLRLILFTTHQRDTLNHHDLHALLCCCYPRMIPSIDLLILFDPQSY